MTDDEIRQEIVAAKAENREIRVPIGDFRKYIDSINLRHRLPFEHEVKLDLAVLDLMHGGDGMPTPSEPHPVPTQPTPRPRSNQTRSRPGHCG